eukprot:SAG11_NODE_21759_length_419_cov_0.918750_2_plen_27_part_01
MCVERDNISNVKLSNFELSRNVRAATS